MVDLSNIFSDFKQFLARQDYRVHRGREYMSLAQFFMISFIFARELKDIFNIQVSSSVLTGIVAFLVLFGTWGVGYLVHKVFKFDNRRSRVIEGTSYNWPIAQKKLDEILKELKA